MNWTMEATAARANVMWNQWIWKKKNRKKIWPTKLSELATFLTKDVDCCDSLQLTRVTY